MPDRAIRPEIERPFGVFWFRAGVPTHHRDSPCDSPCHGKAARSIEGEAHDGFAPLRSAVDAKPGHVGVKLPRIRHVPRMQG
jgi:hypothetical protein